MKRFVSLLLLILLLTATACTRSDQATIEKTLDLTLPKDCAIRCTDDHGGFHGDGTLYAVVQIPADAADDFLAALQADWTALPVTEELHDAYYGEGGEGYGVSYGLPEPSAGCYLYRDRYFAQYGERCAYNPVLQNATFAVYDANTACLYVLVTDF